MSHVLRERGAWVLSHIPECERLLDVGCFEGRDTEGYSTRASLAVGVDIAPEVRLPSPTVSRIQASAANLPFMDASFDVVTFSDVLEHLPVELEVRVLDEISRVLRHEGTLVMTVPHAGTFAWLDPLDAKRRLRLRAGKGHKHYSVEEIEALLNDRFEILAMHRGGWVLHPLSTWLGWRNEARLLRPRRRMSDWDYARDYGPRGFNLGLVARKVV